MIDMKKFIEEVRTSTLRFQGHVPMFLLIRKGQLVTMQLEDFGSDHETRVQQCVAAGYMFAQSFFSNDVPEQVIFVSEAWVSKVEKNELILTTPSADPNRIEGVIIACTTALNTETVLLEIVRDEDERIVSVNNYQHD